MHRCPPGNGRELCLYQRGDEFSIKIMGRGELMNSHIIAPNTVKNILKRHGIEPAPERENLFAVIGYLQEQEGIHLEVKARNNLRETQKGMQSGIPPVNL